MFTKRLIVAGLAVGTGTIAMAQDYFDFGQIPGVPDQAAVQVDLSPTLLGIASATTRRENPAAAELLSSIQGVRVRMYKALENVDDVVEFLDEASERLEREDWERVVSVQDDGNIRIYIRGNEETITGVTAMIVGEAEAIFVNVAGSISAQQLSESIAGLAGMDPGQMLASLGQLNFAGQPQ
ncbi:MAG TPA: DUF4252 domain-containing protein [Gammaproteobacteria bacterium]|nr:DUF4252 domain-containing protein [Gammaproteobacteria bacterium]